MRPACPTFSHRIASAPLRPCQFGFAFFSKFATAHTALSPLRSDYAYSGCAVICKSSLPLTPHCLHCVPTMPTAASPFYVKARYSSQRILVSGLWTLDSGFLTLTSPISFHHEPVDALEVAGIVGHQGLSEV